MSGRLLNLEEAERDGNFEAVMTRGHREGQKVVGIESRGYHGIYKLTFQDGTVERHILGDTFVAYSV